MQWDHQSKDVIVVKSYALANIKQYSRWIVCKIQKQAHILHRAILFEILFKETSDFHVNLLEQK